MKQSKWNQLRGDGGSQPCPPEKLAELKQGFKQLCADAGESVNDRRRLAQDTRFARWAGQSPDGKKHAAALGGEPAFPFEGASDSRVRTADEIVQEQVIIMLAAVMRMHLGFSAESVKALWDYVLKHHLGREWFVELTKLAQYRQGDSPGLGILQVSWFQNHALKTTRTDGAGVMARAAEAAAAAQIPLDPADQVDLQDMFVNPERTAELADLLTALWPEMPAGRAAKVATALQTEGTAEFPYPYICENRLKVQAHRLFDTVFVPDGTKDLQRAQRIDVREWLTETELREMDAKGQLNPGALTEILKHEGETAWTEYRHADVQGDYSESIVAQQWDKKRHAGQYEVLTTFYRASNADGVPGIYSVMWHHALEQAVTDVELFDDKYYPFVDSKRELLNDNLWETRGIAELSMTEQNSLKLLHDSFMDHAQLSTVPPLEVPAARPKMALVIGPLKQIKVNRPGEISFMKMPVYPQSNQEVRKAVVERLDRYFGRMSETNSADWTRLYQQSLVDFFLLDVCEIVKLGLRWVERYLPEAELQKIVAAAGEQIPEDTDGDGWRFDTEVSFEAGMLSLEFLKTVAELISAYVLQWDTLSTIQRDKLVRWFFGALSPTLAKELLVPVEEANAKEVDDEENNFAKIAAGVEPPMMTDGQNFALRLQTLMGIGQANPEALAKLTPVSRAIYEARLKHLDGQVTQQKNAVIGKTMAAPALAASGAA